MKVDNTFLRIIIVLLCLITGTAFAQHNEVDIDTTHTSDDPNAFHTTQIKNDWSFGSSSLKKHPMTDPFDALKNLPGISSFTGGINFKSINVRGFGSADNSRFTQLTDGVDNLMPAWGASFGSFFGLPVCDIESISLVEGPSGVLLGSGAVNGALMVKLKDPFIHQGFDIQPFIPGITIQKTDRSSNFGKQGALRYAKAIGNNFAFKINVNYFQSEDWHGTDYHDISGEDPNDSTYNGIHKYGDEVIRSIQGDGFLINVARTGYKEKDLTDYDAKTFSAGTELHFRNKDKFRFIYGFTAETGSGMFRNSNSTIALKNYFRQKHKIAVKTPRFSFTAYASLTDAGDSYDLNALGQSLIQSWKSDQEWNECFNVLFKMNPGSYSEARACADKGMPMPGTYEFETLKQSLINTPISQGGAKIVDKSNLFQVNAEYDLGKNMKFMDLKAGVRFRHTGYNSENTIFNDDAVQTDFQEAGAFIRASKRLFGDKLLTSFGLRYDKGKEFTGRITPEFSLHQTLTKDIRHGLNLSFRPGFRYPNGRELFSTQDVGYATILGGTVRNINSFSEEITGPDNTNYQVSGEDIIENSYSASSVDEYIKAGYPVKNIDQFLKKVEFTALKPESVQSIDLGYKGLFIDKIKLNIGYFFNIFSNQIVQTDIIHPYRTGEPASDILPFNLDENTDNFSERYRVYTNAEGVSRTHGANLGFSYYSDHFCYGGINYTFTKRIEGATDLNEIPGFNTPKHRVSIFFGKDEVFKNFGFNTAVRWADAHIQRTVSPQGEYIPLLLDEYTAVDLEFNYRISSLGLIIRLGGTNIFNREYKDFITGPMIGKQFYLSVGIENLFKKKN